MPEDSAGAAPEPEDRGRDGDKRWPRFVPIALIVLLPTLVVAYLVFGTGENRGSGNAGPVTAAPVVAGGQSATSELLAALDPSLGCSAAEQTTIARVNQLFAGGRLDPASIPAPRGGVTCVGSGDGMVRDFVAFSRPEDAKMLFAAVGAATTAEAGSGPGSDCRHLVGEDVVVVTCSRHPEVVWSARASGRTGTGVLEELSR